LDKEVKLEKITVGALLTNCYLLINRKLKQCVLIDPGAESGLILRHIAQSGSKLEAIILTHGHIDHIRALESVQAPIYIHREDAEFLTDAEKNMAQFLSLSFSIGKNSDKIRLLDDGQILEVAGFSFKIIHTPGHTPGSISIGFKNIVFTGDTLFAGSIGRTDLSYGSSEKIFKSIRNNLLVLPKDTKIYPGHGEDSTIGRELESNPFLI